MLAERLLAPVRAAGVDTLVLGCTHYPLLARTIGDVMGRDVVLVSSADETAFAVRDACSSPTCSAGPVAPVGAGTRFITSGDVDDVPAPRRPVPRTGGRARWRSGRGADGPRLLGFVRRARRRGVQRLPRPVGRTSIWLDCGNGTFRQPPAAHRPSRISPRSSSPTSTPTTASTSTGSTSSCATASSATASRVRARRARSTARHARRPTGATRSTWNVDQRRRPRDDRRSSTLRFSRTDHPPPTFAVEVTSDDKRLVYTADTGPEWSVGAFDARRRPRAVRSDVPARHEGRRRSTSPPAKPGRPPVRRAHAA